MNAPAGIRNTVAGRYRLEAKRPDGSVRVLADWFPNIVTDAGLNRLAAHTGSTLHRDQFTHCQIGLGATPPAATDVALESLLASSNTATTARSIVTADPYYAFWRRMFSFPAGLTGAVSEVGVGWAASGSLFSRALVLDLAGNPTTVQLQADESLTVLYEAQYRPENADAVGVVDLDGTPYNYTMRMTKANLVDDGATTPAWYIVDDTGFNVRQLRSYVRVYDGPIGDLLSSPSGVSELLPGRQILPSYVSGSFSQTHQLRIPLTAGNLVNGIRSLWIQMGPACYQCQFDPAIPKTDASGLNLNFFITWGRT